MAAACWVAGRQRRRHQHAAGAGARPLEHRRLLPLPDMADGRVRGAAAQAHAGRALRAPAARPPRAGRARAPRAVRRRR